jgi:hypothetical protein
MAIHLDQLLARWNAQCIAIQTLNASYSWHVAGYKVHHGQVCQIKIANAGN